MVPFRWDVQSSQRVQYPTVNIYKNLSMPRGIVNIFNYYFEGAGVRRGAKVDTYNLNELFKRMGYHVKTHEELSKDETDGRLRTIQADQQELLRYDSFIMIFLSHGKNDSVFLTKDSAEMSLDEVRNHFIDGRCPSLKNKPKLFLTNFCRGELEETKKLETDYSDPDKEAEAPKDMMTIYASIKNFKAMRDPDRGTVFVQALCEVLAKHAHDMELNDLYSELCTAMRSMEGTTPECQNYNFKKFFFNPIPMAGLPRP